MANNCCKDCPDRTEICHDDCERYKAYKDAFAKEKARVEQIKSIERYASYRRNRLNEMYRKGKKRDD